MRQEVTEVRAALVLGYLGDSAREESRVYQGHGALQAVERSSLVPFTFLKGDERMSVES